MPFNTARKSKRNMLAALSFAPFRAIMAGRNTLDYVAPDTTRRIRLHETDVPTFHPGGEIDLDTGDFNTMTTRDRINKFLPNGHRVSSVRGVIYLDATPFLQNATLTPDGEIDSDITAATLKAYHAQIDAYMRAWKQNGLPARDDLRIRRGAFSAGKVDEEIMREWVADKWVFRQLYRAALIYAGMQPVGVDYLMRGADRSGLDATAYRRIRRYVRVCLGLGV